MTQHANIRGAMPVGRIEDLEPLEGLAVLYLRLWCEGPCGQSQVWNDLATGLGASAGRAALAALEEGCTILALHGRRKLMRHQPGCSCLGADEACFAALVAGAATGEREDAMLLATLLVRPDMAPHLVAALRDFGLAVKRMLLRGTPAAAAAPKTARQLH
ncbi:hypothetical protein SAMN05216257_103440 [Meinhardsimonia xiamenensis]|uniref:Uncharacterized protein n=1 Tax=Meinhardsimonia xiamenensis TaxID=990712 RepID=A0A1G9DCK8_9RHOB|nr:hypothetical protein [Meinhardsimonia xiamenensis]PRX38041.1 hypothetical protein LV81_00314 [Meinhardsimonia xiamenensis]SDK61632.1 hypothetical protein SAMN05216257_103440 [Meinhardsimonia xiamenensis]